MKKILTGALVGVVAAGALAASGPASARDWDHGGRHHDNSGAAVAAGIIGLALGAVIASGNDHRYYDGYAYDRPTGYYGGYSYDRPTVYYGGYGGSGDYTYARRCHTSWRWDPYVGEYVRVRACY